MTGLRHLSGYAPEGIGKAVFSADWRYRYQLRRIWVTHAPPRYAQMVLIGLNPSKANHVINDQTVTKGCEFARQAGCGSLAVVNLGALVATDPAALARYPDWVGEFNDQYLLETCTVPGSLVIAGWGMNAARRPAAERAAKVTAMLTSAGVVLHCFGVTAKGQPVHLSRLPYASELRRWEGS